MYTYSVQCVHTMRWIGAYSHTHTQPHNVRINSKSLLVPWLLAYVVCKLSNPYIAHDFWYKLQSQSPSKSLGGLNDEIAWCPIDFLLFAIFLSVFLFAIFLLCVSLPSQGERLWRLGGSYQLPVSGYWQEAKTVSLMKQNVLPSPSIWLTLSADLITIFSVLLIFTLFGVRQRLWLLHSHDEDALIWSNINSSLSSRLCVGLSIVACVSIHCKIHSTNAQCDNVKMINFYVVVTLEVRFAYTAFPDKSASCIQICPRMAFGDNGENAKGVIMSMAIASMVVGATFEFQLSLGRTSHSARNMLTHTQSAADGDSWASMSSD